jgi:hypothetical protein
MYHFIAGIGGRRKDDICNYIEFRKEIAIPFMNIIINKVLDNESDIKKAFNSEMQM